MKERPGRSWHTGRLAGACIAGALAGLQAMPAAAERFTTAAEVRPILSATRDNWVALRTARGRDILYFTQLEAWRCGLDDIRYSVNGGPMKRYRPEPCHEESSEPNALTDPGHRPWIEFPAGSVKSVAIEITYDDGRKDSARYSRRDILMP